MSELSTRDYFDKFVDAVRNLASVCDVNYATESLPDEYPGYLPRLDKFAADLKAWRAANSGLRKGSGRSSLRPMVVTRKQALERVVEAASNLRDAWEVAAEEDRPDGGYPSYLPSFDEFVLDLMAWRDANT